jgi:nucleoside-diphosphate-sugar epimerase
MADDTTRYLGQGRQPPGFRMSRRVLVTGATGFIGRQSLPLLAAAGYEVHAVTSRDVRPERTNCEWHRADLLRPSDINRVIDVVQPSHLLHFAWYAVPGKYLSSRENLRWCSATIQLLAAFAQAGGHRAVLAGSCFEYDFSYGYCVEDLTPANPDSFYGVCKNAAREVMVGFRRHFGLSAAWGRIFYLFGPNEPAGRLVSAVMTSLLKGEPARCTHGRQIRDFLYVEEVAAAFVALLTSELCGTVNIGSGEPISLRHLVNGLAAAMGTPQLVEFGALPPRQDDPPLLVADVRKLRERVGWHPRLTLEDGLQRTVEWWREHIAER